MAETAQIAIIRTNLPDQASADRVARAAMAERLAACTNAYAITASVYRWESQIVSEPEVQLHLKTTTAKADALVRRVRALHPYELPFIAVERIEVTADYSAWVDGETRSD
ncbi:MAG: divalent-cation tolerance protein CutA [Rubricella sp.]